MRPEKNGRLKIFQRPKQETIYALGADVAEGLALGDASTICVIDKDLNQAAAWYGRVDPDLFGSICCKVGEFYNHAMIVPEINNMGHTTLNKIKSLGYSNVYTRQVREELSDEFVQKIGWRTDRKSKHEMLNEFVAHVRDGTININDIDLLKEMSTLYVETDGNVELNGKDRVVAICLAIQGIKQSYGNSYDAEFPSQYRPKTFAEKLDMSERKQGSECA